MIGLARFSGGLLVCAVTIAATFSTHARRARPAPLGSRFALSESRPNPFAAATQFEVTLERPGPVEVAIFDLGVRRLYTVHRGDLPAGTHEFTWDGRLADGSRASAGVYFYRVDAGDETLARKLVLLRTP